MVAATPAGLLHETILTIDEARAKLKCSRGTLTNWFREGLEGFRLHRRVYTTIEALERFSQPITGDDTLFEMASRSSRRDPDGDAAMAALHDALKT